MTSVTLAVEDVLSEGVLIRMLAEVRGDLTVAAPLGFKGNTYLQRIVRGLNKASKGSGFIMLTDQDDPAVCPITLVNNWLGGDERNPNFLFRVAVMEVEAWLLADREEISRFLGVPLARLPQNADTIPNPKQFLVNLARSSNRSNIREDLTPRPGGTAIVGPNYNGRLVEFIQNNWSCKRARDHSDSLARAVRRFESYRVTIAANP